MHSFVAPLPSSRRVHPSAMDTAAGEAWGSRSRRVCGREGRHSMPEAVPLLEDRRRALPVAAAAGRAWPREELSSECLVDVDEWLLLDGLDPAVWHWRGAGLALGSVASMLVLRVSGGGFAGC